MPIINWEEIKTANDLFRQIDSDDLFDNSSSEHNKLVVNPNLNQGEKKLADFLRQFVEGIILITGDPGQGKSQLMYILAWYFRYYFNLMPIFDKRPRPAFGLPYLPFSMPFLIEQLDRMSEVQTGVPMNYDPENPPTTMPHITRDGKWISTRGEVLIRKTVWGMDEFISKYMYKYEHNKPETRLFLKLFTLWRHMQCVIIGVGTDRKDLAGACNEKITCEIRPERISPIIDRKTGRKRLHFGATMYPLKYRSDIAELVSAGAPELLEYWADVPLQMLGGNCWKDIFNTNAPVDLDPPKSLRPKKKREEKEREE